MATISIEFGKESSQKTREVYLLVRQGKTRQRVKTGVRLNEQEYSPKTKKIKSIEKARIVEKLRLDLIDNMSNLTAGAMAGDPDDAHTITKKIIKKQEKKELEFFAYAEDWVSRAKIKGAKNYLTMLNTLEKFLECRKLFFQEITVTFLKDFEAFLDDRPRAQSLYIGQMRHIFREAMLEYNTDDEIVIKNDPFLRYKAPKQVLKKGVRALSLEQLMKVVNYQPKKNTLAELAHDCFILSFCLMGMNSVDMYQVSCLENGTIKYKRTKTRDRRSDEAYIEVKVHPYIQHLMEKWKGEDRIFRFYKKYYCAECFNQNLNIGLKTIGKAVGINKLQFYQARHTFATLSRNLMKFSKGDVDEALNHVGNYEIADVYITKDFSIINDNNFKLLDKVFNLTKSKRGRKPKKQEVA